MSDPILNANTLLVVENRNNMEAPLLLHQNGDNLFVSYFENQYGEQWLFVHNRENNLSYVYGGDVDWEKYAVEDGVAADLVLSDDEQFWILACYSAATGENIFDMLKKIMSNKTGKL